MDASFALRGLGLTRPTRARSAFFGGRRFSWQRGSSRSRPPRMSSHRPFVLGVLVLALAGCTAEPDPAPLPTGPSREALLDALERDTGSPWVSSTGANEGVHDPQLLVPVGHVHLPGTTGTDRATRFVARYASLLGGRAEDLGSARLETATGTEGETTIVSFRHRIPGSPHEIFEATTSVHMIADGEVVGVESGFGADTSTTAREASVTEGDSRTIAMAAVRKECGDQGSVKVVEVALGGHVGSDGIVRLSHRIDLEQVGSCVAPRVFVDATTRESSQVFDGAPRLADRARGGRSYYWDDANDTKPLDISRTSSGFALRTEDAPTTVTTRWYGKTDPVTSPTVGTWGSLDYGLSVDAHSHTVRALRFFWDTFRWDGVDGRGSNVDVVVHDPKLPHTAYYDPSTRSIHFGDGGPVTVLLPNATFRNMATLPMQLAYDGVVHEVAHGVALATAGFVYYGESAAIHESFADVMGTSAKLLDPSTRPSATFDFADVAHADRRGGRSLLNPERDGSIASYAKRPFCLFGTMLNDYCFAHATAGIGNRAFALMVAGGTETLPDGRRVSVTSPISVADAAHVWFDTVTHVREARPTFPQIALAQVKRASAMGPSALNAVACAWSAVGVLPPSAETLWGAACLGPSWTPKGPSCSGYPDGTWLCDDNSPNSAVQCRGGVIGGGTTCKNPKHRCLQAAPANFLGRVDATSGLLCQ